MDLKRAAKRVEKLGKSRGPAVALNGELMAKYRTAKGLSQQELAEKIGAEDAKTVQRAEAGKPTTFLHKIAEALGVHPTQLVDGLPESAKPVTGRVRFTVMLDVPPDMLPVFQREPLAAKFWLLCQLQALVRDGVPEIGLEFGSVMISADLSLDDAARMMRAFTDGALAYLSVKGYTVHSLPPSKYPSAPGKDPFKGVMGPYNPLDQASPSPSKKEDSKENLDPLQKDS